MNRQAGRQVEPVQLVIVGLGQILFAVLHDYVASGAGTVAAASVFELNAEI